MRDQYTAFLVLLAKQIFPFALRMIKATSPRHRVVFLVPLLYLCSAVKPLLDLNHNLGIVSGMARFAVLAAVPDFLQGMNVALLFLDYDWDKNPLGFQEKALALPLCVAAILPTLVKIAKVTHSSFMNVSIRSPPYILMLPISALAS